MASMERGWVLSNPSLGPSLVGVCLRLGGGSSYEVVNCPGIYIRGGTG